MARPKSTDGNIDALGSLITAALDLDWSWFDRGACTTWHQTWAGPTPWQFDPGVVRDGIKGDEMIEVALLTCQGCPVQYQCAKFAVLGRMNAGTWAMHPHDLVWLGQQKDRLRIISDAEAAGLPVGRVVRQQRDARRDARALARQSATA